MTSTADANTKLTRTVLIAATAAASVTLLSSTLTVLAVAHLLQSTAHRTRSRSRRSRTATACTTRKATSSVDSPPRSRHRQSSLFAWCLRRLSGRCAYSDSDERESSSSEEDSDDDQGEVARLPGVITASSPVAAAAGSVPPAAAETRRATLGSKGPRAYHTHDGGIITQYMAATTRLETDDYFKKNATQRRDTVALAERRTARLAHPRHDTSAVMDLALFSDSAHTGGGGAAVTRPASVSSAATRPEAVHPVSAMLADAGLEQTPLTPGDRRGSTSLSLLSASAAMPLPQNPIYRVVITGGPCSGKSTSMTYLKAEMEKIGYTVYLVPEVATLLMTGGARLWLTPEEAKEEEEEEEAKAQRAAIIRTYQERIAKLEMVMAAAHTDNDGDGTDGALAAASASRSRAGETNPLAESEIDRDHTPRLSRKKITIQRVVLQLMMMLEDCFYELAAMRGKPSVIFYDRGTMDGSAYCTDAEWAEILHVTGYTDEELRDTRYDAVVHMVTAALGAEEYYTLENNATRHETREEAITQDMATRNVWRGHFLFYVCDNSTDFATKLGRVAAFVRKVIGASPAGTPTAASAATEETAAGTSASSSSLVMNDLQELAYIMTGSRGANKHMLLSPSNSRERSMSPSMGLSSPQSAQFTPADSPGLDHSVMLDVNATTVGTTLMPTGATGGSHAQSELKQKNTRRATEVDAHPLRPGAAASDPSLTSPTDGVPAFADNDSNSLHSHSRQDSSVASAPAADGADELFAAATNASSGDEAAAAEDVARPSRRRVTLPPSDLAAAAAAASMTEARTRAEHASSGEREATEPSPSPDLPEGARAGSADSTGTAPAGSRTSRKRDYGASLTLNADDLHQQDSLFSQNILADEATNPARRSSPAASFEASAAEGLQRHFVIRSIDMSKVPANAVESEVTLITLVPTRREYVSETIIRVVRCGSAASTRPLYLRRVEFTRQAKRADDTGTEERLCVIRNVTTRALLRDDFLRLAQFFDPAQPLVRKQVKRFLHGFNQLSVVTFLEPEELRGSARVVCAAEVSADDLPDWIEVEAVSLTGRDVLV